MNRAGRALHLSRRERSEWVRFAHPFRVRGFGATVRTRSPLTRIAQARSDLSPAGRGDAHCETA